jgi:hypothetical protein
MDRSFQCSGDGNLARERLILLNGTRKTDGRQDGIEGIPPTSEKNEWLEWFLAFPFYVFRIILAVCPSFASVRFSSRAGL